MKKQLSQRLLSAKVSAFLTLCSLALVCLPASHSSAWHAQDNRQLQRDSSRTSASEHRTALVIGNGAYTNAPPLRNPPNDTTLIATTLKKLGFEVSIGTNKSQREMKQLIREFGQRLRAGGGVGLFYFAGHGVQSKGHNYLVPIDADIQNEADLEDVGVDVNYILNMMDDAQSALNIVILDACRNNPFGRSFRSAQGGLAQVKAPTGTLIAYATAPDSTAADGDRANSPYTEELTRQMETPGVVLETMFRRVTEQVSSRTAGRQEPWVSDNHKGEFYFGVALGARAENANTTNTTTGPASISDAAKEEALWEAVKDSSDAQDFKDYLAKYPNGAYADAARVKLRRFEAAKNDAGNSRPANTPNTNTTTSNATTVPAEAASSIDAAEKGTVAYGLVIDNSGSLRDRFPNVIEAAKLIVKNNKRGDATLVVRFISSDKIDVVQDFTSNLDAINDGLDFMYPEGGQSAIVDAVYLSGSRVAEYHKDDSKLHRALVLITDGDEKSSFYSRADMLTSLKQNNIRVFVIGIFGTESKWLRMSKGDKAKAIDLLNSLATETGGKAYFPKTISEMMNTANDIAVELRK